MKVGYYLDVADPELMAMAPLAIASARAQMPGMEAVHVTADDGPVLECADREVRVEATGVYPYKRVVAQRAAGGDMLFLDVDTLVKADLSGVWGEAFDIALPVVRDPFVKYTGAVVFVRKPAFWDGWIADPVWAKRYDLREMLVAFTRYVDAWPGKVLRLEEDVYERLPRGAGDAATGAKLVHYRGPRKRWFPGLG